MPTIDGLITGLDTSTLVEGLVSVSQRQIDLFETRKQTVTSQQTSFKGIEARLLSIRSQVGTLARTRNSPFDAKAVSVSDENLISAAASDDAVVGVYNVKVNQLARAEQVASQGFDDVDAAITQGTLQIQLGNGTQTTITVDSTNNTLQGLTDAINNSGAEVSATIINDGSATNPYRLLLTGSKTGAQNAITITNSLADLGSGLTKPDFQTQLQAASDASISLGSGAGALTILSDTNQIDEAIAGVTIDLLAADSTKEITVSVTRDTKTAKTAITDFVGSFNNLMEYIDDQIRFDAESGTAGVLLGNRSVVSIQDKIRTALTSVVPGLDSNSNRISAIGVSISSAGRLVVNSAKLDDALAGNVEGVDADDLRRLFSLAGKSDNANVQFSVGSNRTKATQTGYQVDISQAAERATITATNSLAGSIVIDGTNNGFVLKVDGKESGTLTLKAGTYTASQLAEHVESVVNASTELAVRNIDASVVNNKLQITSNSYGLSSEISVVSGTSLSTLGFAGTENDKGVDVVGKFVVNGVTETARGTGRLLAGDSKNANTADLRLRVTLTPSQVQTGTDATVTVTRGIASVMDQILSSMLDPISGRIKTVNDGFDSRIEGIDESIKQFNERLEAQKEALIAQFIALESAVSSLQTTGDFLASQLTSLTNLNRNR